MDAAKADYRVIGYPGAAHGFTNPEADTAAKTYGIPLKYDSEVDRKSWADMREFFGRVLG